MTWKIYLVRETTYTYQVLVPCTVSPAGLARHQGYRFLLQYFTITVRRRCLPIYPNTIFICAFAQVRVENVPRVHKVSYMRICKSKGLHVSGTKPTDIKNFRDNIMILQLVQTCICSFHYLFKSTFLLLLDQC